jgi:hypothetical protein
MKPLSLFPKRQTQQAESPAALDAYWSLTTEQLLSALHTRRIGIQEKDAENRTASNNTGQTRLRLNDKPQLQFLTS